jgi:hypothetical protein
MMRSLRRNRLVWVGIGLLAGVVLGSLCPNIPLHGSASDRSENIVMATGYVDETVEAVFFLDSLTGRLYAGVPSLQRMQDYQSMWEANPGADMIAAIQMVNAAAAKMSGGKGGAPRPAIQPPQTPRFVMVTGLMDVRQGAARMQPSRCVVHVCEANTGIVMTYLLPWSRQMHNANQPLRMPMQLWAAQQFSTAVIRPQE